MFIYDCFHVILLKTAFCHWKLSINGFVFKNLKVTPICKNLFFQYNELDFQEEET